MIAVKWSRRGSWHLQGSSASPRTLCGRARAGNYTVAPDPFGAIRSTLPGDEKTCERCAVIAAKRAIPRDPRDPSDEGPA